MSKIEVDAIDKQSGSTLTLGGSGTAVTLACGATQSGFGATGGISWQTTIKTGDFTAVSGEGYFVNTSGGSNITVTLPASPSAGNVVAIKDYARTFGTNKVIIARNGSNMDGQANNTDLANNGDSVVLVFMDATKGWSFINEETTSAAGAAFIVATGGNTVSTCGNFKIHTFTSPGTFCVSATGNPAGSVSVDYLVVAGGGGAGGSNHGGGAGAGGYRESSGAVSGCYPRSPLGACVSALPVTAQGYPITVGGGGTGGAPPTTTVTNGSNSVFSSITSAGGGYGGSPNTPPPFGPDTAGNGGSGGGAYYNAPAGTGNTPPVTPPQGNNGGTASATPNWGSGGGGGATAVGGTGSGSTAGNGGAGATSSINGATTRAGGGGGGVYGGGTAGTGGPGGGGAGAVGPGTGTAGTTNTGGGGGAGAGSGPQPASGVGGAGGSGIVIIRYKFQ